MDILANVTKTFTGALTGLVFKYKPMPQSLKNHIQESLVSDALLDAARSETDVQGAIQRKIGDSLAKNRVQHNVMTVRACLVGIDSTDGPATMGDLSLGTLPRVSAVLGGLPCSLVDSDVLGAILDQAPDVGEDLWKLVTVIHAQPTAEEKKS
jgi:hypothetical protein